MRCIECNIILSPEEEKRGRCELCISLAQEATEDYLERLGDEKFHEMRDEVGAANVRRMFGGKEQ